MKYSSWSTATPGRRCSVAALRGFATVLAFGLAMQAKLALAATPTLVIPSPESFDQPNQAATQSGPFDFVHNLPRDAYFFGDMWGLRSTLAKYGITFALQETSEYLANVTGGIHRGGDYDGLLTMGLQVDTQRAFGWYGGTFNVSALQYHGRSLSADNLGTLQTASGIEADRATRLWELWYQQKFLDEDRLDVKVGQQSLDQEFMVNPNGAYLINTMFGWPMVPSVDMPGGGPAYPLSALGVRVRYRPVDALNILAGVFNGSPSPSGNMQCCSGDPQVQNPSGTSFPLNGGVLMIVEAQYTYPSLGTMMYPDQPQPLSRVYKIGAWYNTESFADQQFSNDGLSLANPNSNGIPLSHHGDWGFYATADQMIWMDSEESDHNVNLFGRVLFAPQADRNLVTFSMNAGLTLHEPFRHRDDDTFAIGMGFAKVSGAASALDQATASYTGTFFPVRTSETYLEMTYQYQVAPWWQIQPDIQYVFNPGGGILNPNDPTTTIKNELVLGVRTNILF
jgi:porin